MLGLGNNQEGKYEAVRKNAESRSGGFDIMRMRFSTVSNAVYTASISPTIRRALETSIQADVAARDHKAAQEWQANVDRIAAEAATQSKLDREVGELNTIPNPPEMPHDVAESDPSHINLHTTRSSIDEIHERMAGV